MKKESAATLPAIPDDPSVPVTYIPHPTAEKRERISFADLWPSRETQGGRRGAPMAIIACAALLSAACLLALYGVSARLTGEWSWSAPWEALQGFLQGGGGGSALPSVPVDSESEEDPTAETESPEEPSGTVGEPSDTVNGEGSSEPPADLPTAEDGTVTDAPTQDGGTATDEPTADESPTQEPPTDIPDPEPSVPAGMIPIVGQDVSQADKGIDYVIRDSGAPPVIPWEGSLFEGEEPPAVLLIHSHPFEGYSDGGAWFDPTKGGLSQTASPYGADGVVALGAALTRYLREAGITVIHLRVYAEEGETADAVYTRVEGAVEEACALYQSIGLILDLRRSAELTETGGILRTKGYYWGGSCAQVGLSVHGLRPTVEKDLAIAQALRSRLWGTEVSLSRPVRIRGGEGMAPTVLGIPFLTLELGSAGNTYTDAERLVEPLGDALAWVLWGKP